MTLVSKPLLLFTLISAMLLYAEGDTAWAPMTATQPPAAVQPPEAEPESKAAKAMEAEPAPAQTPVPRAAKASLADEIKRIQASRLACVADAGKSTDLFASKSWYVPPPPPKPVPPPPPPPPTAPPLPFAFMGSYHEPDGKLILFLTKGEQLYTVSPGDVIDGIYRVEEIVGGQLGLTYLPLNIRQSMTIGEAS